MSTSTPGPAEAGIPKAQLDLIQQFEADYNAVDRFLRKELGADNRVSFTDLVRQYSYRHKAWTDADLLRIVAEVRNAVVHGKTEPYAYAAVPTPRVARGLSRCRERLLNPVRAITKSTRKVETLSTDDTLAAALKLVAQKDLSQFPVYEEATENGVTRWLARYVATDMALIDLEEVTVGKVLQNEEKRRNYSFVSPEIRLDDVVAMFTSQLLLEAVLFTNTGKETEALMGICTRSDVMRI
jgi:predicted transcriptional regulator